MEKDILKQLLGEKRELSPINNPFKKECIDEIQIYMTRSIFDSSQLYFKAYIRFKNGNTSGEQKIEATSLEDAYNKVYDFCAAL